MNVSLLQSAINRVYSYIKRKGTPDPDRPHRVATVLNATGSPHQSLSVIHVTGTKGKGSTSAMLAAALQANGYTVGLYTSPHLHDLRERIQVNNTPIPPADFIRWVNQLAPIFDRIDGIGFPEVMTCIAFHHFAASAVDFAVIEVHLGGRYDATNIVTPVCSVITTIDYDHTDILGSTLAQIAHHKAGIIKPDVPIVTAPQHAEALTAITQEADHLNAPLHIVGQHSSLKLPPPTHAGQSIDLNDQRYTTNLIGTHQGINLAVALTALNQLQAPLDAIRTQHGLNHVQWGGRFELIQHESPLILDIAHNVAAARVLRHTLDTLFPDTPCIFVYGSKPNKDIVGFFSALIQQQDHLVLVAVDDPPTAPPAELATIAQSVGLTNITQAPSIAQALHTANRLAEGKHVICITGSIFVVAAAGAHLI